MQFSPDRDKQGGNLPIAFEGISSEDSLCSRKVGPRPYRVPQSW